TVSTGSGATTFTGAVDGAGALTVNSTGTTTFNAAVGNTTPLASVTTNAGGGTVLNGGAVTTTGAQEYDDNVSINGHGATLTTANGPVSFAGTTTLGKDLTVSSGNGAVMFTGAVDGANDLRVTAGGTTTFSTAVGTGTALASVTTDGGGTTAINGGAVRTTRAQTYEDGTLGQAATPLTGTVNFKAGPTLGRRASPPPTAPPGTGPLNLTSATTVTSTFAGTAPSQFGHVVVSGGNTTYGNATLALNYSGFTPAPGNSFDVVGDGGSGIGQFVNAPAPGPVTLN